MAGDRILPAREAYDHAAALYDTWHWQTFWRRNEAPLVMDWIHALGSVRRVLDVGTGTGFYAVRVAGSGTQVIGIDPSEGMLRVARRRAGRNTSFFQGDVRELPFDGGEFDLVICARVLTHVADGGAALREIRRVLRPGGHVIVTDVDGAHCYRHTRVPTPDGKVSVRTYKRSLPELLDLCGASGLASIRTHRLTARTVRWIPPGGMLRRLDRSGRRPVGYACLLSPAEGVLDP